MPLYSLPKTSSTLWSGSLTNPGAVVQGVDVVKQRALIVINTPLGSDPLRPLFGTDIYTYIDKPLFFAAAKIKQEIIDAIKLWVPEVKLDTVKYTIEQPKIKFTINMSYGGEALSPVIYTFGGSATARGVQSGIPQDLIIDADIPYNRGTYVNLDLKVSYDGSRFVSATPAPPVGGFYDMDDATAWAKANWGAYGDWGCGKYVMVLYGGDAIKNGKLKVVNM